MSKKVASDETVLARARRMMRSEMRKIAQTIGLDEYDPATFAAEVTRLVQASQQIEASDVESYQQLQASQQRIAELEARVTDLTTKLRTSQADVAAAKREAQQVEKAKERQSTEFEIRDLAMKAGVTDIDYGLHLLRGHLRALPSTVEATDKTIVQFFEGLKKDTTKKHIFREQTVDAGPRPLATQLDTPPAPDAGGEPKVPAPGSGTKPADANALDMKKTDFAKYVRDQYNYTPGMA